MLLSMMMINMEVERKFYRRTFTFTRRQHPVCCHFSPQQNTNQKKIQPLSTSVGCLHNHLLSFPVHLDQHKKNNSINVHSLRATNIVCLLVIFPQLIRFSTFWTVVNQSTTKVYKVHIQFTVVNLVILSKESFEHVKQNDQFFHIIFNPRNKSILNSFL